MKDSATTNRIVRLGAWCALVPGIVLALVALLGDATPLGNYRDYRPKHWDRFDPALVDRIRSREQLVAEARRRIADDDGSVSDAALMGALFDVTTDRFVHGAAEHTPFTNWIVWVLSLPREHGARIKDSNDLLRRGHSALCGQISNLLVDLAHDVGIQGRTVELEGHVVMEARLGDRWHLYDGDAEVGPASPAAQLPSVAELAQDPAWLQQLYAANNPQMIPLILSTEDNRVGDPDHAAIRIEQIAGWAKYAVPGLMVVIGLFLLSWHRRLATG